MMLTKYKDCNGENNELRELKEENKKLKAELNQIKDDIATETMCIQCKTAFQKCKTYLEIEGLRVDAARAKMKAKKYKQALEEIKNLLYTAENTTNGDLYFELVSKAYMKCSEVLNEG